MEVKVLEQKFKKSKPTLGSHNLNWTFKNVLWSDLNPAQFCEAL